MKEYKPTLKLVKNKWYVSMTVPFELHSLLSKQIRLSTGTNDKNEAQKRLPELAIQLKKKISDAMKKNEFETLKLEVLSIAKKLNRQDLIKENDLNKESLISILEKLSEADTHYSKHLGTFKVSNLQKFIKENVPKNNFIDRNTVKKEVLRAQNLLSKEKGISNNFKLLAEEWLQINTWNREKSKRAYISHIDKFINFTGDLNINEITKVNLYDFAELMATKKNSSKQTIKNYLASIRAVFSYAERKGKIEFNPTYKLNLEPYGTNKKERKPFPTKIIRELFNLELPKDVRLLWSIMISTGMRLDEVALLSVKDIKEERGIRYFDLTEMKVKNKGSSRKVPIPDVLIQKVDNWIKGLKSERLFSFPLNSDGKAQNAASKKSMYYIRQVTADKDLVAHSFRHTFKDLVRDAGISKDLHDFITGHSGGDSSSYYGEGYSLETRKEALDKVNNFHQIKLVVTQTLDKNE